MPNSASASIDAINCADIETKLLKVFKQVGADCNQLSLCTAAVTARSMCNTSLVIVLLQHVTCTAQHHASLQRTACIELPPMICLMQESVIASLLQDSLNAEAAARTAYALFHKVGAHKGVHEKADALHTSDTSCCLLSVKTCHITQPSHSTRLQSPEQLEPCGTSSSKPCRVSEHSNLCTGTSRPHGLQPNVTVLQIIVRL